MKSVWVVLNNKGGNDWSSSSWSYTDYSTQYGG